MFCIYNPHKCKQSNYEKKADSNAQKMYNALTMYARVTLLAKGYNNRHQSYSKNSHRKIHLLIKAEYSPIERMRLILPNFLKRNCILTLSGIVGNPVISGVMKYKC